MYERLYGLRDHAFEAMPNPRDTVGGGAAAVAALPLPLRDGPAAVATSRSALHTSHGMRQHLAALVERIFLPVQGEPTRRVAFSAVGTGATSGAITAAAAEMLAQQTTATVCAVDANFGAPSLYEHFRVRNAPGLAEALASDGPVAESARQLQRNLWVVPAGMVNGRPSFAADDVRARMTQLIAQFDYVLVDAEPFARADDAAGLAPLVGGVILVIAAESTRRESARCAAQILHGSGAVVMGAVLTNRRFPIPDGIYRLL